MRTTIGSDHGGMGIGKYKKVGRRRLFYLIIIINLRKGECDISITAIV